jgi:hypothetical protein
MQAGRRLLARGRVANVDIGSQGLGPPLTLRIKSDNSTNDVELGLGGA